MAQSNGIPEPRRILRVLPAVTGPVPGNAGPACVTEPVTGPVTLPGVTGNAAGSVTEVVAGNASAVPLSAAERIRLRADTAARVAGDAWAPCARLLDRVWHPEPETMAQHRTYIRSREWVAPGITGKSAAVIAWAGILYHAFIAQPVKYAMKAVVKAALNVEQAADRPLRFLMFAVFVSALILILLYS